VRCAAAWRASASRRPMASRTGHGCRRGRPRCRIRCRREARVWACAPRSRRSPQRRRQPRKIAGQIRRICEAALVTQVRERPARVLGDVDRSLDAEGPRMTRQPHVLPLDCRLGMDAIQAERWLADTARSTPRRRAPVSRPRRAPTREGEAVPRPRARPRQAGRSLARGRRSLPGCLRARAPPGRRPRAGL
jgi:hypothetical protein